MTPMSSQLSDELISILRCPSCRATLEILGTGGYRCTGCGHEYPETRGVVRFVPAQNYADNFGFQWHKYDRTQLDEGDVRSSERLMEVLSRTSSPGGGPAGSPTIFWFSSSLRGPWNR